MDREEYLYCKKEMMRRKTQPYSFGNLERANEFYNMLKIEYPSARLVCIDGLGQYITLDSKSEKKLKNNISKLVDKVQKQLEALNDALFLLESNPHAD